MKKIILYSFLFFYLLASLAAIDIKLIRKFTLEQDEKNFIIQPGSFFVTEDSFIFVIDYRASDIKIFEIDGKLINVFGRKGTGPNEFVRPFYSSYKKPLLALVDLGIRRYYIYKRVGKTKMELVKCCQNTYMPQDIRFLTEGKLLICGNKLDENGRWQNLYIYDYGNNKSDFLISNAQTYGYRSESDFKEFLYNKVNYIGQNQFIDLLGNTIYHAWTGDLRLNKIDIKTRGFTSFGKKTENYVPPYVTPEIEKAHNEKQSQIILEARSKMTYVMDIFSIGSKTIGLVYVGPLKKNNGINVMMQFYSCSGDYIKEVEVLLNSKAGTSYELFFYFKKDANLYYVLETETSEEFDQVFNVYEYRITE